MRIKKGIIVSTKMTHTIVVKVEIIKKHKKYEKKIRNSVKFYAHADDNLNLKEGDSVTIKETRPLSKLKRWEVIVNKEEVK